MSKMKNSIPYDIDNCEHGINIHSCIDCLYALQTAHLAVNYTPSIEVWYKRKKRRRR